jgi:group I intron endonuclease
MADTALHQSGIYCIRNIVSGRVYVGSAINIRQRWAVHRKRLRDGTHHSPTLQRSWLKHGPDAFVFEIIEAGVNKEKLINREQYWIDTLGATLRSAGFNISPTAGSPLGTKRTRELRARMSAQRKGRKLPPFSDEHRAAISAARKGKKASPDARKKMSDSRKGKKRDPFSDSHRSAISAGKKGKKVPKISIARMGTKASDATRKKLSEIRKGKKLPPFSEAHRCAISTSRKGKRMNFSESHRDYLRSVMISRNSTPEMRAITAANNRRRAACNLNNQLAFIF